MSRFGRHFVRIRELKSFEKKFLRVVANQPGLLNSSHEALFRYALTLAQMHTFDPPGGDPIDLVSLVDPLRRWMTESIVELIDKKDRADETTLREIAPVLALRVEKTRNDIVTTFKTELNIEDLDDEIRHKKLVLVLGGGGGSGLAHLGTFKALDDLNIDPSLIVGSSMGSIMGLFRCVENHYDPMATALALPEHFEYNSVFKPFTGFSRFGFPGAFHFNLLRPTQKVFQGLYQTPSPRFSDLAIPLEVVVSGIRVGFELEEERYAKFAEQDTSSSHHAMRSRLRLFFSAVSKISRQPRFLTELVLGRDDLTKDFPVIEAVGFSCAVPGLLHYDVFHDDPETIQPLESIFERDRLLRMCDGGIVNNVPSRVAWNSVQSGTIGSRNALIASFDVFAPIKKGSNMIWIPMQQIAKGSATANSPYSDFEKTFRKVPSPLQIIVNSYSKLKAIVDDSHKQLEDDLPTLQRALEPLPPYGVWLDS